MENKLNLKQLEVFQRQEMRKFKNKNLTSLLLTRLIEFLNQGLTTVFIANYRKDEIGGVSETIISKIKDDFSDFCSILNRQTRIIDKLKDNITLESEREEYIYNLYDRFLLEEYFLSVKPDKKTRATNARQLGLQDLSDFIKKQTTEINAEKKVESFMDVDQGISSKIQAIQGASDILAEEIANDLNNKKDILKYELSHGLIETTEIKQDKFPIQFKKYLQFKEILAQVSPFQLLQIFRAQKLRLIQVKIRIDDEKHILDLNKKYIKDGLPFSDDLYKIVKDSYIRLIEPVVALELISRLKKKSIKIAFEEIQNKAKAIFYSKAIPQKNIMGIYPGTESGCKLAIIDSKGNLVEKRIIFLHQEESKIILTAMFENFKIDVVAIADDRGYQKASQFVLGCCDDLTKRPVSFFVSKLGAIGYSNSQKAEQEFSDIDKSLRRAIYIAKQVQNPLGLYSSLDHRVLGLHQGQSALIHSSIIKQKVDQTLIGAIHFFGVDVNDCSASVLKLISGLNANFADKIIAYRKKNGNFQSRSDLARITEFDSQSFKQAVGFLRVYNGSNALDSTSIHPEKYELVEQILTESKLSLASIIKEPQKLKQVRWDQFSNDENRLCVQDIRRNLEWLIFSKEEQGSFSNYTLKYNDILSLKTNQICTGIVVSVAPFGVFIDVGVHEKALVHSSNIHKSYLSRLEIVKAKFLEYDEKTKRLSFSMKEVNQRLSNYKNQSSFNKQKSNKNPEKNNKKYTVEDLQSKFKQNKKVYINNTSLKVSVKAIMRSGR